MTHTHGSSDTAKGETHDFDSVNAVNGEKRNFDTVAATWDTNPVRVKLAHDIVRAIRATIPLTPDMDVLDFGCGTGLLGLGILPTVRSITGVDSSQGMIDVLNEKIREQGFHTMRTVRADLEEGDILPGQYNLVASSMAFHHIRQIELLLQALYGALRPGGTIAIADLDCDEGRFHESPDGVFHNGFDRSVLKSCFERAGFTGVRNRTAALVRKPGRTGELQTFSVFLMTGRKPD